jgi:hypothetical protein
MFPLNFTHPVFTGVHQIRFNPPSSRAEKRTAIFLLVVRNLVENFYHKLEQQQQQQQQALLPCISLPFDHLVEILHQQFESTSISYPAVPAMSREEIVEILHELERSFSIGRVATYAAATGENMAASTATDAKYYQLVSEKFAQDQSLGKEFDSKFGSGGATTTTTPSRYIYSPPSNISLSNSLTPQLLEFTVNPWRAAMTDIASPLQQQQQQQIATQQQQRLVPLIPPALRSPLQFDSAKMKFFYETLQQCTDSGVLTPDQVLLLRPVPIVNWTAAASVSSSMGMASVSSVLAQIQAEIATQSGVAFLPEKDLLLGLVQRHRHTSQFAVAIIHELVRQGRLVRVEYTLKSIEDQNMDSGVPVLTGRHRNNNNNQADDENDAVVKKIKNSSSFLALKAFSNLIGLANPSSAVTIQTTMTSSSSPSAFAPSKLPPFAGKELFERFSLPAAFQCALYIHRILGPNGAMTRGDLTTCLQHLGWKNPTFLNALIDFLANSTRLKLVVQFSLSIFSKQNDQNNNNNNNGATNPMSMFVAVSEKAKDAFEKNMLEMREKLVLNNGNVNEPEPVYLDDLTTCKFYHDLKKALLPAGISGWEKENLLRLMKIKFNWNDPNLEARCFSQLISKGLIKIIEVPSSSSSSSQGKKQNQSSASSKISVPSGWQQLMVSPDQQQQLLEIPGSTEQHVIIVNYMTPVFPNNHHQPVQSSPSPPSSSFSSSSSFPTMMMERKTSDLAISTLKSATKNFFDNLKTLLPPEGLERSSAMLLMNHQHGWSNDIVQADFLNELLAKNLIRQFPDPRNPALMKISICGSEQAPLLELSSNNNNNNADCGLLPLPNTPILGTTPSSTTTNTTNSPIFKILSSIAPSFYNSIASNEKQKKFLLEFIKMIAEEMFGATLASEKLGKKEAEQPELEKTLSQIIEVATPTIEVQQQNELEKLFVNPVVSISKTNLFLWIADNVEIIHGKAQREEALQALIQQHQILAEYTSSDSGAAVLIVFNQKFKKCFNPRVTKEDIEADFAAPFSCFEEHFRQMILSSPKATPTNLRKTQLKFLIELFRIGSIGKREAEPFAALGFGVPREVFLKWMTAQDVEKLQEIVNNTRDFDDLVAVLVKNGFLLIAFGLGQQQISLNHTFAQSINADLFVVPDKAQQKILLVQHQEQQKQHQEQQKQQQQQQYQQQYEMASFPEPSSTIESSIGQRRSRPSSTENYDEFFYTVQQQHQQQSSIPRHHEQNHSYFQPGAPPPEINAFNYYLFHQQDEDDFFTQDAAIAAQQQQQQQQQFEPAITLEIPWAKGSPISFPPPIKVVEGVVRYRPKEAAVRLLWAPPPFLPVQRNRIENERSYF